MYMYIYIYITIHIYIYDSKDSNRKLGPIIYCQNVFDHNTTFLDTHSKILPDNHIYASKLSLELGFNP